MNYKIEENNFIIYLEGRIDSINAQNICDEILSVLEKNQFQILIIDVEKLDYISSAGLRMFLTFKKKNYDFKIVNAPLEVYDVFEMTGFTQMFSVSKAYKKYDIQNARKIGEGAKGIVYRYSPEIVVKVYKKADSLPLIQNERQLAQKAFVLGIPTAISYDIVKVGDNFASVFELVESDSYSQLIKKNPEKLSEYAKSFADFLKKIHSTEVSKDDMSDGRIWVKKWILEAVPYFSEEENKKILSLYESLPCVTKVIHCDYQTNNLLMQNNEPILIDMDTLSYGHPIIELSGIYRTYVVNCEIDKEDVEKFLGFDSSYCQDFFDLFFNEYFSQTSESEKSQILNKIAFLGYIHVLSHYARRIDKVLKDKNAINFCVQKIRNLLFEVDKLDF